MYGPHSTRGAGVKMFKKLGLSSDEVCAIGKWRSTSAFAQHYLRVNATQSAADLLSRKVRSVSPWASAEDDWLRTPGTKRDLGGSNQESEARTHGETCAFSAGLLYHFSCVFSCGGDSLLLFFADSWRIITSLLAMQATNIITTLSNPEHPAFEAAWSTFMFNVEAVRGLGQVDGPSASAILTGGQAWQGAGWTTGKASRLLYKATGVPLVSAQFEDCKGIFLYALALHWNLDVTAMDLKAPDGAFALSLALSEDTTGQGMHLDQEPEAQSETEADDLEAHFAWEEILESLPADLATLWRRYGLSTANKFDVKQFLEQVPRFQELPTRPPENNALGRLEQGSVGRVDKVLKVQQQTLLHLLCVLARLCGLLGTSAGGTANELQAANPAAEPGAAQLLAQQVWAYTAASYGKLSLERREQCLPGCSPQEGEVLFGPEEVKEFQKTGQRYEKR